jgi:hypothetical protein
MNPKAKKFLDFIFQVPDTTHEHQTHGFDINNPHIILDTTATPLDTELQRYIAAGASLSLDNCFPLNIIDPKQHKQHMVEWLAGDWHIYTLEDLEYELTHLYRGGHSVIFNTMLQAGEGHTNESRVDKVIEIFTELMAQERNIDINLNYDYLLGFSQYVVEATGFIMSHFAPLVGPIKDVRTDAYDIDRIVTISRVAYGAGLFTEQLAVQNITWAGSLVPTIYKDWREFAIGYLLGRAIWGGVANQSFLDRVRIVDLLLQDPQSPWNTLGWFPEPNDVLFEAKI